MTLYDPNSNTPRRGGNAGWLAGAAIIVLIIVGLFWWGGSSTNTASNPDPSATASRPLTPSGPGAINQGVGGSTTGSGSTSPAPSAPLSPPATNR